MIWRVGLGAAAVLVLAACGETNETAPRARGDVAVQAGISGAAAFEVIDPCPFEAAAKTDPARLLCGYLSVPENRNDPASAALRIPVAVIRTLSASPEPDPVVFLHGGPGGGGMASDRVFDLFSRHMFGASRDFILLDQRGALLSDPALTCDGVSELRLAAFAQDYTLEERDMKIAAGARACLESLARSGRDLRGYSAAEIAHDLRDLREALGIAQWNLMGVSYGTFVALEAVRIDQAGVRSLILDSVVSPQSDLFLSEASRNFDQGLSRVIQSCELDIACQQSFPDLEARLARLLDRLTSDPARIVITGPPDGETAELRVNWHDFLSVVHWMLYNENMIRLVPLLIAETEAGNLLPLTFLADNVFPAPKNSAESASGAFFATVCEDQYRQGPRPSMAAGYQGFSITSFMTEVCGVPAFGYAGARDYQPVSTEVPILVLSGHFDPMTPDIYAHQLLADNPHAEMVSVPGFGHSTLSGYMACQTILAADFLNELRRTGAFDCVEELTPPAFILSMAEAASVFAP